MLIRSANGCQAIGSWLCNNLSEIPNQMSRGLRNVAERWSDKLQHSDVVEEPHQPGFPIRSRFGSPVARLPNHFVLTCSCVTTLFDDCWLAAGYGGPRRSKGAGRTYKGERNLPLAFYAEINDRGKRQI